jgi:hypothetical protein
MKFELPLEIILLIYDSSCWVTRVKIRMTCKLLSNASLLKDHSLEKSWIESFKYSYEKYGFMYYQIKKFMVYHTKKNKNCDDRCCNNNCSIELPLRFTCFINKLNNSSIDTSTFYKENKKKLNYML